jgi:hypothetical protein
MDSSQAHYLLPVVVETELIEYFENNSPGMLPVAQACYTVVHEGGFRVSKHRAVVIQSPMRHAVLPISSFADERTNESILVAL